MQDAQTRLDKGAAALLRLMKQAEKGAAEACAAGMPEAAATLHRMAAYMRLAYAEGRTLDMGGIRPAFGDK